MSEEEKNLKDSANQTSLSLRDTTTPSISYTKTNNLVTALFMVTDIMDRTEPLRLKLRTLGAEVISDIHSDPIKAMPKVVEILSFLDVAFSINLLSEMNSNILKKEFLQLAESVKEYKQINTGWLEEFLAEKTEEDDKKEFSQKYSELITVRHDPSRTRPSTRLGVQKASTLMSALSGVNSPKMSIKNSSTGPDFELLKKHRRADIVSVLRGSSTGLTITDIKTKSKGHAEKLSALVSCGEKTLQRELVSMVRDGVLKKEGEKRWSRYSIA